MKKMTKTITLLVSALLCVSLVSCGETDSYDDTDYMEAGETTGAQRDLFSLMEL